MKVFRLTARSRHTGMLEPSVDWFETETAQEAVEAWQHQAAECGISPEEIVLVSIEEQQATP
jgi:hypothetical protein